MKKKSVISRYLNKKSKIIVICFPQNTGNKSDFTLNRDSACLFFRTHRVWRTRASWTCCAFYNLHGKTATSQHIQSSDVRARIETFFFRVRTQHLSIILTNSFSITELTTPRLGPIWMFRRQIINNYTGQQRVRRWNKINNNIITKLCNWESGLTIRVRRVYDNVMYNISYGLCSRYRIIARIIFVMFIAWVWKNSWVRHAVIGARCVFWLEIYFCVIRCRFCIAKLKLLIWHDDDGERFLSCVLYMYNCSWR